MWPRQIVLVDCDETCTNPDGSLREGMRDLLTTLFFGGCRVIIWSANGADHCRETLRDWYLPVGIEYSPKPPERPITEEWITQNIGSPILAQIDDKPAERGGPWPFLVIQ